jgi:hypothetical protein
MITKNDSAFDRRHGRLGNVKLWFGQRCSCVHVFDNYNRQVRLGSRRKLNMRLVVIFLNDCNVWDAAVHRGWIIDREGRIDKPAA